MSETVLYLITSHRNPAQVLRLARAIRRGSARSPIAIHHDRSRTPLDPAPFGEVGGVHILPFSVPVEWGGMSIVGMNLRSFRWVLRHLDFDWLVLISGQDYPVKPLHEIEAAIRDADHDGFMESPSVVSDRVVVEDPDRIRYSFTFRYYYRYITLPRSPVTLPAPTRGRLSSTMWRALPSLQRMLFLHPMPGGERPRLGFRRIRTPFTDTFRCYKASPWFTLRRRAVERVTTLGPRERELWRYYRRTVIPDESYFQTILFNDRSFRFHPGNKVFSKWRPDSGSPEVLTRGDVPEAMASDAHFARKFDEDVDAGALDELDRLLS